MKLFRKYTIMRLLAGTATLALMIYWYLGHRPIAYHNQCLRTAIGHCARVEITSAPKFGPDGQYIESGKLITLSDRAEMDQLLDHFDLPWHLCESGEFHECGGHLRITIVMQDSTQHIIRYDHGDRIYPMFRENNPGYAKLSDTTSMDLNNYFKSLGFSAAELGVRQ